MARRVSNELIDRQVRELRGLKYPSGRSAEFTEELDVISWDVFEAVPGL